LLGGHVQNPLNVGKMGGWKIIEVSETMFEILPTRRAFDRESYFL